AAISIAIFGGTIFLRAIVPATVSPARFGRAILRTPDLRLCLGRCAARVPRRVTARRSRPVRGHVASPYAALWRGGLRVAAVAALLIVALLAASPLVLVLVLRERILREAILREAI